jgi:hypothetical protein
MWTDGQTCKARALDESSQIVGVFCYCVNLYILLYKIIYDGIHGTAILWFKSLVENRRQELKYGIMNLEKPFQIGKH